MKRFDWKTNGPAVVAVGLAVLVYAAVFRAPTDAPHDMAIHDFGRLPVVHNGRVKPFDSLARESLLAISHKQTFKDAEGERQPAIKWLLDAMSASGRNPRVNSYKVYRIENLQVLDLLGLQPRSGFRYAIDEFDQKLADLFKMAGDAHQKQQGEQEIDFYERKILELANKIQIQLVLMQRRVPLAVPPKGGQGEWRSIDQALQEAQITGAANPVADTLNRALEAYGRGDIEAFNTAVENYKQALDAGFSEQAADAAFEHRFNAYAPFFWSKWLYLFAFILAAVSWLSWGKPLNRAAFSLMTFVFVVHTAALIARIVISGRPPVTTLYSSAIFIGWGAVLLGLILERIYKLGIGNLVAAVAGFLTLMIADALLIIEGDTFKVLQAVLDTNFWLATHVVCISMGYATTYLAGLIAVFYILIGVFTPGLTKDLARNMTRMIYGIICFALFFSFVGTVLGGLWADDSWGRFWGWDPKENGALIIVLWNALILHARWGGMVRERGIANLAVFGNIVTSWSWFGVNELGKGLHAYGFTEGTSKWLIIFVFSQLAIIAVGLLPKSFWRSTGEANRPAPDATPPAKARPEAG